jgi:hypothetical protein
VVFCISDSPFVHYFFLRKKDEKKRKRKNLVSVCEEVFYNACLAVSSKPSASWQSAKQLPALCCASIHDLRVALFILGGDYPAQQVGYEASESLLGNYEK